MRSFVVDGNFTADHIKQKRPQDDVWLSDGEGIMTAREPYATHVKTAKIIKDVGLFSASLPPDSANNEFKKHPCEPLERSFRAILDANLGSGVKDVTGIGAHGCARHGCYCPSSGVNFSKGETQSSVDYSLSETCKHTHCMGIRKFMHIYDIECQYCILMAKRFSASALYISLPPVEFAKAIGMFHVHGHQDSCFFRYATSFIKGAANVDGEIMETNWSILNTVSPSLRTATLAHRSEVLDDHMNDGNWKKLVSIGESAFCSQAHVSMHLARTIINKYRRAIKNEEKSRVYFEDLSTMPSTEQLTLWEKQISKAEVDQVNKPKAMDIMAPNIPKGRLVLFDTVGWLTFS